MSYLFLWHFKKNLKENSLFNQKGFTLIELMVSLSIFLLVMTISMGAIISILDANQKSQTLRSVVDNLNATVESIDRAIRFGTNYHSTSYGTITVPRDTLAGDLPSDISTMSVLDSGGNETTYSLVNGQVMRSIGGNPAVALTSPDVVIQTLSFRVFGSYPYTNTGNGSDSLQPSVLIVMKGTVTGRRLSSSSFALETMVSQRQLDSQ